jgi:hypothetical protein
MIEEKSRPVRGGSSNKCAGQNFTAPVTGSSSAGLVAALEYASENIPTFFLSSSKRPLANCRDCSVAGPEHVGALCDHLICHGHLAATCDPVRLRLMAQHAPCGLVAIRTGAASGLVVVDIDPRSGGDESLGGLVRSGLLPPTARVVTGANGQHLYYRHPGQHIPSRPLPGWRGVDIKGDGGYVVAPPSTHPRTGRPYFRVDDGRTPVEMTSPLVSALTVSSAVPVADLPRTDAIRDAQALLGRLLTTIANAPEGSRRTTLYGASRGVARIVATGKVRLADAVALLHEAGQRADQSEKDRRNAIVAAFRAEGVAL